jgi:PleD family two-component response regulator
MTLGVSISTEAKDFMETVKIADDRLYFGKRNGKKQVVWDKVKE